jgi:DNA polymerase III epsilon subunit-like protein
MALHKGAMKYICLDFETNGFPSKEYGTPPSEWTLPFHSYPIQLSIHSVHGDTGEVEHVYTTLIKGATRFAPWVVQNVPITLCQLVTGKAFHEVLEDMAALIQPGDVLVAHNAQFDLNIAVARTAGKLGIQGGALQKILEAPRFCTYQCAYSRLIFGKRVKLQKLCEHFQVTLDNAHDARADSKALAECVSEALHRGVMMITGPAVSEWVEPSVSRCSQV